MLPDVLQGIGESTYVRSGQRQRTRLVRRDAAADEEHLVNGRQSTPVLPRPQAKQGVYVSQRQFYLDRKQSKVCTSQSPPAFALLRSACATTT